ncbi:MAG: hypothetical protein NUV61_01395 [Candidatus Azambacteria bacterium]|nr:hypothetical protein [Candidatus Azambacteria bacterium]
MTQEKSDIVDLRTIAPNTAQAQTHVPGSMHWEAEEFPYNPKDLQWFLVGGIFALGLFASLLILKNMFGAVTILLFVFIIYLYATKKPDILSIVVDGRGITINRKHISYSDITSFWVLYEPPTKDLIVIQKANFTSKTIIPLGQVNPTELRALLIANAITEKEEEETLIDILARRFGF